MSKKGKKSRTRRRSDPAPTEDQKVSVKPKTSFRQAIVIILVSVGLFFGLLEAGLALLGVEPVTRTQDPFVGFASNAPLFVPSRDAQGRQTMITAPNKTNKFNLQEFTREKSAGTYRIFCLGGSTTYGRPYTDPTSFAGWLRELLPVADRGKNWEVINAGGISYASYRVAHLMEELIDYQPDLFVIYTGHNEFLEERTYRKLREIPSFVRSSAGLLAHTRTWAAMADMLEGIGTHPETDNDRRDMLGADVEAKLDRSVGPDSYTRDDTLQKEVLDHYRLSLERMVTMARSVGARVIFVTPASNLKDSSPFKSEHTEGLGPAAQRTSEQLLSQARLGIRREKWDDALDLLQKAVATDPRNAEIQYRLGKALAAKSRFEEAEKAFRAARDEDVCPLRALTPMRRIVTEVARERGTGLVDYVGLIEKRMQDTYGHPIPGKELFLDHVHPTIEGHKLLAVALIQSMIDQGLARPEADWGEQAIAAVAAKIEAGVDKDVHGQALANLARVLLWAGKKDDSARLARQALDMAGDDSTVARDAASILATYYQRQGYLERARRQLSSAIESAPDAVELRVKLSELLLKRPFMDLAKASAHLMWVRQQTPENDLAQQLFGQAMLWRGRPRLAYGSLTQAIRLNPKNATARKLLAQVELHLQKSQVTPRPHRIQWTAYPSGAPKKLVQLRQETGGRMVSDGIEVEFYENGRVRRLIDIDRGTPKGFEITWDRNGHVVSRIAHRQGAAGDFQAALQELYAAIEQTPDSVELRLALGKALLDPPFMQLDEAAANLLWVCHRQPANDLAHQLLGQAMARRGHPRIAYGNLMEALRLNPQNQVAKRTLAKIRPFLTERSSDSPLHEIESESPSSPTPGKLQQLGRDTRGNRIPDGIQVEFYENGRIKRLQDFDRGIRDGLEIAWDADGRILSSIVYLQGSLVDHQSN